MSTSLEFLSRRTDSPQTVSSHKRWLTWLLPVGLLAGFAILFVSLFRDLLLPAPVVSVAVVLATSESITAGSDPLAQRADRKVSASANTGQMLFQASGWVEPDPFAIKATVLTNGIVADVHVLEGQMVEKGDLLAELVDDDAKLGVDAAESMLQSAQTALSVHVASIAVTDNARAAADAAVKAAVTVVAEAEDQLQRFEGLKGGAVSESDITVAKLRLEREKAHLQAAQARVNETDSELKRLRLETHTKEAQVQQARVSLNQAQLTLNRMRIHAPISGRVLRLAAVPGERKMLNMDHPESSTVAILYDPEKVQVRVDVPLADAAGLAIGQSARIHCSLLPDQIFTGEVTRINGEADLQRNTLQAKVRINGASDLLRPEMLCRVEFLALEQTKENKVNGEAAGSAGALSTWVPETALSDEHVWVVDADTSKASKRTVKPATERRDGYQRVLEGLLPGEHVIINPDERTLQDGRRVNPVIATKTAE